jgi:hypothetical protein
MKIPELPKQWLAGDAVSDDQYCFDPPESPDKSLILFYGCVDGDAGHRIYSIPADTPVGEVVRFFRVGTHGAESYGVPPEEALEKFASRVEIISSLVPCRVIFADPAGLKLKFMRQITRGEVKLIETLFPFDEVMTAGLEFYLSEWDGEGSLLDRVLEDNAIKFWWD